MHLRAAQFLAAGFLTDRGFHQRGAGQIKPAAFGHEQRVAHHRQIAAAGHAIPHDRRELRYALRADDGVIAKDAAEIVLVGENLILHREEHAGRIDEVENRQLVIQRKSLGPQHFLARGGKERAGFHRRVVHDDDTQPLHDAPEPHHHAGRRDAARLGVHAFGGPEAQFEEVRQGGRCCCRPRAIRRFRGGRRAARRSAVAKQVNALAGRQASELVLSIDALRTAPQANHGLACRKLGEQCIERSRGRRGRIGGGVGSHAAIMRGEVARGRGRKPAMAASGARPTAVRGRMPHQRPDSGQLPARAPRESIPTPFAGVRDVCGDCLHTAAA